ncbi:MAG: hypothetical protein J7K89_05460 [Candidatus Cloacimonetes bacterium]|nr:hypothetical protein [Candidatus Cloacimonadota bacterium]
MKKMMIFLLLCFSVMLIAENQVGISIALAPPFEAGQHFNVIYPANFSPTDPESQPMIFTVDINFIDPGPADGWYLIFHAGWDGDINATADVILTPEATTVFPLHLTNRDILRDDEIPYFEENSSDYDDFIDAMEDAILETGQLPDGEYTLSMQAFDGDDQPISELAELNFTILAATPIILITPGMPFGSTVYTIGDALPLFIWASNLRNVEIRIFELDNANIDITQLESMDPVETIFPADYENSYAYQPSNYQFNPSKVYAWNIAGHLINPAGSSTDPVMSSYYTFKYEANPNVDPINQTINNMITNITDPQVDLLVNLLNNGYSLNNVIINGQAVDPEYLINLLTGIQNGTIEIESLIIQ